MPLHDSYLRDMPGPRETLEDRLGMFYYYWNPEVHDFLFYTITLGNICPWSIESIQLSRGVLFRCTIRL